MAADDPFNTPPSVPNPDAAGPVWNSGHDPFPVSTDYIRLEDLTAPGEREARTEARAEVENRVNQRIHSEFGRSVTGNVVEAFHAGYMPAVAHGYNWWEGGYSFAPDRNWTRDKYEARVAEAQKLGLRPETLAQLSGAISNEHFDWLLNTAQRRQEAQDYMASQGFAANLAIGLPLGVLDPTSWPVIGAFGTGMRFLKAMQATRLGRTGGWVAGMSVAGGVQNVGATAVGDMAGIPTSDMDYVMAGALGIGLGATFGVLAKNPFVRGEASVIGRVSSGIWHGGLTALDKATRSKTASMFGTARAMGEAGATTPPTGEVGPTTAAPGEAAPGPATAPETALQEPPPPANVDEALARFTEPETTPEEAARSSIVPDTVEDPDSYLRQRIEMTRGSLAIARDAAHRAGLQRSLDELVAEQARRAAPAQAGLPEDFSVLKAIRTEGEEAARRQLSQFGLPKTEIDRAVADALQAERQRLAVTQSEADAEVALEALRRGPAKEVTPPPQDTPRTRGPSPEDRLRAAEEQVRSLVAEAASVRQMAGEAKAKLADLDPELDARLKEAKALLTRLQAPRKAPQKGSFADVVEPLDEDLTDSLDQFARRNDAGMVVKGGKASKMAARGRKPRVVNVADIGPNDPHPKNALVLAYHATRTAFDKLSKTYLKDFGFHFGTREASNNILGLGPNGDNIYGLPPEALEGNTTLHVVISAKNVLDVEDAGDWQPFEVALGLYERHGIQFLPEEMDAIEAVPRRGGVGSAAASALYDRTQQGLSAEGPGHIYVLGKAWQAIEDALDRAGVDALRYRNKYEDTSWSYVVWKKGVVKGADDRNHTWYSKADRPLVELPNGRTFALRDDIDVTETFAKVRAIIDRVIPAWAAPGIMLGSRLTDADGNLLHAAFKDEINVIYAALNSDDIEKHVFHETIHALKKWGVIGDPDWQKLVQKVNSRPLRKLRRKIEAQYPELKGEALDEELVAQMLAGRFRGETFGVADAILEKLVEFFRTVRNALGAEGNIRVVQDIFAEVESGQMARLSDEWSNPSPASPEDTMIQRVADFFRTTRPGNNPRVMGQMAQLLDILGLPPEVATLAGRVAFREVDGPQHNYGGLFSPGEDAELGTVAVNRYHAGSDPHALSILAHEWGGHALDYYFGKLARGDNAWGFISNAKDSLEPRQTTKLRKPLQAALYGVFKALFGPSYGEVLFKTQALRAAYEQAYRAGDAEAVKTLGAKISAHEVAFRKAITAAHDPNSFAKVDPNTPAPPGFLEAFDYQSMQQYLEFPHEVFARAMQYYVYRKSDGRVGLPASPAYTFRNPAQADALVAALDKLFATVKVRQTARGAELYSRMSPEEAEIVRVEMRDREAANAMRNLSAVHAFLQDPSWRQLKDANVPGAAGKYRFDPAWTFASSLNDGTRAVAPHILNNSVGMKGHAVNGEGNPMNLEQAQLYTSWWNDFTNSVDGTLEEWAKARGLSNGEKIGRAEQFLTQTVRNFRAGRRHGPIDPHEQKLLDAFFAKYAEVGGHLQNPFAYQGGTGRPVKGSEFIEPGTKQLPRVYSNPSVEAARRRFGDGVLVQMLAGSHNSWRKKNGLPPLQMADLTSFMALFGERIVDRANGIGVHPFDNQLGITREKREQFIVMLRERGISEDFINEMVSMIYPHDGGTASAGHLKRRMEFDESYVEVGATVNDAAGHPTRTVDDLYFADILENDLSKIAARYFRQMSGWLAAARTRIEIPGVAPDPALGTDGLTSGGYLVNGLTSQEDIDALLKLLEQRGSDVRGRRPEYSVDKQKQELDQLNFVFDRILGRPNPEQQGDIPWFLRMTRGVLRTVFLGMMGVVQMGEFGNAIGAVGLKAMFTLSPSFRKVIDPATGKKIFKAEHMQQLNAIGLGGQHSGFYRNMADELDEMPWGGVHHDWKDRAEETIDYLGKAHSKWVGQDFATNLQEHALGNWMIQDWADFAMLYKQELASGKAADWSVHPDKWFVFAKRTGFARRASQLGIGEPMMKRIFQQFIDNTELRDSGLFDGRVASPFGEKWKDKEAHAVFNGAIWRTAKKYIQTNDLGSLPRLMRDNPYVQTILQFRAFPFTAWANQFQFNVHMGDTRALLTFAWTMMWAAMAHAAMVNIKALGRMDQDEYLEKNLNWEALAKAGFSRAGWASIIPIGIDSANVILNREAMFNTRSSGLPFSGQFSIPAYAWLDNLHRGAGGLVNSAWEGRRPSQTEARQLFSILPFNSMAPFVPVFSHIVGPQVLDLPERPPRLPKD